MKLIIQIPCYNEEKTLPQVINELPKTIEGVDTIEYQIIDDGCSDGTVKIAKRLGVHHIVRFRRNRGLGAAFRRGVANALMNGADIVVNTDGDNQYPGKYIPKLVRPIVLGQADIVIGNRQPTKVPFFGPVKKFFQWLGNKVVSTVVREDLPDAVSGFRAYSREALYQINTTSEFSYVIDTIIQAYKKGLQINWVTIKSNPPTRPSRLFGNIFEHIKKSTANIIRVYITYEPLKVFILLSLPSLIVGILGVLRYLYYALLLGHSDGMIQSLIISGICLTIGITLFALGILGDVIAKNRVLMEQQLLILKRLSIKKDNE